MPQRDVANNIVLLLDRHRRRAAVWHEPQPVGMFGLSRRQHIPDEPAISLDEKDRAWYVQGGRSRRRKRELIL